MQVYLQSIQKKLLTSLSVLHVVVRMKFFNVSLNIINYYTNRSDTMYRFLNVGQSI